MVARVTGTLEVNETSPCRKKSDFGGECGYIGFAGPPPYEVFAFKSTDCTGEIAWSDTGIGGGLLRPPTEWNSFYFRRRSIEDILSFARS